VHFMVPTVMSCCISSVVRVMDSDAMEGARCRGAVLIASVSGKGDLERFVELLCGCQEMVNNLD
jgi:hypothetical protein